MNSLDKDELIELAEVRHDLLTALGALGDPTYALQQLEQFKEDIEVLGILGATKKWRDCVDELGKGQWNYVATKARHGDDKLADR